MKIELGGADHKREGWTNLDWTFTGYDLTKTYLSEIPDNSVDVYYSSHCFEHMPINSLPKLISNIFRSLKPNGYFRLSMPSIEKMVKLHMSGEVVELFKKVEDKVYVGYIHNDKELIYKNYEEAYEKVLQIMGGWNPKDFFNGQSENSNNQFGHYYFADKYLLYYVMWSVGFRKINFFEAGESELEEFKIGFDHSGEYTDFVEAQKTEKYQGVATKYFE